MQSYTERQTWASSRSVRWKIVRRANRRSRLRAQSGPGMFTADAGRRARCASTPQCPAPVAVEREDDGSRDGVDRMRPVRRRHGVRSALAPDSEPNPLALLVIFAAYSDSGAAGAPPALRDHVAIGAMLLAAGFAPCLRGRCDAGDGRLLAIAGLWIGFTQLVRRSRRDRFGFPPPRTCSAATASRETSVMHEQRQGGEA